uniref:Uncharacterized protein n=1 Tax=Arundo donax TaxID=35708 RepID=A0A0A8Z5A3_ARUDO
MIHQSEQTSFLKINEHSQQRTGNINSLDF